MCSIISSSGGSSSRGARNQQCGCYLQDLDHCLGEHTEAILRLPLQLGRQDGHGPFEAAQPLLRT